MFVALLLHVCCFNMAIEKCCAPGCRNDNSNEKRLSFFSFPKEPGRCYKWLRFCGLEHKYQTAMAAHCSALRLCSVHFSVKDYFVVIAGQRRKLISTAVPSIQSNGTTVPQEVSQHAGQSPTSTALSSSPGKVHRLKRHQMLRTYARKAKMQQTDTAEDMPIIDTSGPVSRVQLWSPVMSSTPKATFGKLHGSDTNMSAVAMKGDHVEFDPLMLPEKLECDTDEQSQIYQWIKCESGDESLKTEEECVTDGVKQEPCSNCYSPERDVSCIMKQELIIKQEDNDEEGIAQNVDRPEFVHCNENFSGTSSSSVTQDGMSGESSAEFSQSSDTRDPLLLSYNYTIKKLKSALSSPFSVNVEEESSMELKPELDERDPLVDKSGTNCTQSVNSGNIQDIAEETCSINVKSSLQDVQNTTYKELEKECQPANHNKYPIYVQKTYSKKKSPLDKTYSKKKSPSDKTYLMIDGQIVPCRVADKESLLVNPQVKPPTFPVNKPVGTMEKKPNQTCQLQRSNLKPSRCKSSRVLTLPLYKVNKDQVSRGIALSGLKVIMKKKPNQICHPQEGNLKPSKNECVPLLTKPPSSNQVNRGIAVSGLKVIIEKSPNQICHPQEANLKPSKNECVPLLTKPPSSDQVNREIALSGIKEIMKKKPNQICHPQVADPKPSKNECVPLPTKPPSSVQVNQEISLSGVKVIVKKKPNQICNPQEPNLKPSKKECVPLPSKQPSSESSEIESPNSSTCNTSSKDGKMTVYEYKKMVRSLKESPEIDNPNSFTHKTRSVDEKMTVYEYKKMVQSLKESSEFESPYSFTCKTNSKDGQITVYEYKKMVQSLKESPEIDNPNTFTCKTSSKDGQITVFEYKKKVQSLMEKLPAVKLKRRCYVPGCTSNNTNSKLFAFPRNLERTCKWLQQIGINCSIEEAKDYAHKRALCRHHFGDDQYQTSEKKRLKCTAVPLSLSAAPSDDVGCPNES